MVFQLILVAYLVNSVLCGCNPNSGPAGSPECVPIATYFFQYQWATCLSNAYIQQKSAHKHICTNRLAMYCYYQCMLEVHGKEYGLVSRDCSCTPGQRITQSPGVQPTTLPPWCLSPSGKDCHWYRNCLEKKYPCEATSNAYAIKYAEKFCSLFENNKNWFTLKGQQWIDAVRKCLQVTLVPLLRPWRSPSCQEIRKVAFDSHTPCYVNPDKNVSSVCDLECKEFFKIFYAIKTSFIPLDTAWESLKGLWNIIDRCGLNCTKNWYSNNTIIKITKMGFKNLKHQQSRRSIESLPQEDKQSRFADKVVSAIAIALRWNGQVLDWFAYHDTTTSSLYVVLADKKGLGIVQTSTPAVNLNDTVSGLALAIKNSTLPVQVNGENIWLTSLNYCKDKSCDQTQSLAVSSKPPVFPTSAQPLAVSSKPPVFPTSAQSFSVSTKPPVPAASDQFKPRVFPSSAQAIVVNGLLVGTSLLVQLTLVFLWSIPQ